MCCCYEHGILIHRPVNPFSTTTKRISAPKPKAAPQKLKNTIKRKPLPKPNLSITLEELGDNIAPEMDDEDNMQENCAPSVKTENEGKE